PPPILPQNPQRPRSHHVGSSEDRVNLRIVLQQPMHRRRPALLTEVTKRNRPVPHHVAIAVKASDTSSHIQRTRNSPDTAPPLAAQISHRLTRSTTVVRVHERATFRVHRPPRTHRSHSPLLEQSRQRVVPVQRQQQRSVHVLAGQITLQPVPLLR